MESLYRTYRPQTFADMVGQRHIVSTLRNALSENRVAHAYLFSGPRGTGKTTTARVLAKALLCTGAGADGPTPEPDGTCEQCQAIAAGTHPDVYELDAASRTGVDNVREEIINRVAFAPTRGRYKVYIIDEVHMLTTAAFNALLKTLEEPPAHVIFILCTTDPQKVPETILSRCQRLEFHRIATEEIAARLAFVCEKEGFTADPDALELIARHSRGGLRDALSMLEQLSVFGDGSVRLDDAQTVLGEVGTEALARMVEQIAARDVAGCFAQVADLADRGVDIAQYARDLTSYVRDLYVASVTGTKEGVLSGGTDAARASEEAEKAGGSDRLARMLDLLGQLETNLRTSLDQRLSLEVTLTRIARPQADLTIEALAERVALLERQVAAGAVCGAPAGAGMPAGGAGAAGTSGGYAGGAPAGVGVSAGGSGAASAAAGRPVPVVPRPNPVGPGSAVGGSNVPAAGPVGAPAPAARMTKSGMPIPRPTVRTPSGVGAPGVGGTPAARPQAPAPRPQVPRPVVSGGAAGSSAAVGRAGAAAAVPPTTVGAPQGAPVHDAATAQRLWGQFVDRVRSSDPSIAAFVIQTEGALCEGGVLALTNHGSSIVPMRLMSPKIKVVLERLAADVYGAPVQVAMAGAGSAGTPAASAAGQPAAAGQAGPATRPGAAGAVTPGGARPMLVPGMPSGTAPRPAALTRPDGGAASRTSAAAPRPSGTMPGAPTAMSRPAAPTVAPRPVAPVAAAGTPVAAAASAAPAGASTRPSSATPALAGSAPAVPARPVAPAPAASDEAPAYEAVPDEVYDAYVPDDDDRPPFDDSADAPSSSAPTSVADSADAPAPEGGSMDDLAKMLSAGFGGFVKISEDNRS